MFYYYKFIEVENSISGKSIKNYIKKTNKKFGYRANDFPQRPLLNIKFNN